MNTFAYVLIILGLICISAATRGRRLQDIGPDLRDLSVAFITSDIEGAQEVLGRKTAPVDPAGSFTPPPPGGLTPGMQAGKDNDGNVGGSGKSVNDLVALGKALRAQGYQVGKNKALGDPPRPGAHLASGHHYKFDNSGAIDINWPNANQEAKVFDQLAPIIRRQGFHVLWRVKGHYDHMHVDISRRDI